MLCPPSLSRVQAAFCKSSRRVREEKTPETPFSCLLSHELKERGRELTLLMHTPCPYALSDTDNTTTLGQALMVMTCNDLCSGEEGFRALPEVLDYLSPADRDLLDAIVIRLREADCEALKERFVRERRDYDVAAFLGAYLWLIEGFEELVETRDTGNGERALAQGL